MLNDVTSGDLQRYRSLASKLDTNEYKIDSWILVQFMDVGIHDLHITTANKISSVSNAIKINTQAPITGLDFQSFTPPVANRTSNISFTAIQV